MTEARRPRRRRRPSTLGGRSSSTPSSSVDTATMPENDYPDLEEVREAPTSSAPAQYDPLDPSVAEGAPSTPTSPMDILMSRGANGTDKATKSQRDMRVRMVAKSMLRGVDEFTMAKSFNVSVGQIRKDVRYVKEQIAKQASEMDINDFLGDSMMFFKEIQFSSLRIASKTKTTDGTKLAALRTALASRADMARLMKSVGVFDALPFVSESTENKSDIEVLTDLTKAVLTMDLDNDELTDEDREFMDSLKAMEKAGIEDEEDDDIQLI